MRDWRVRLVAAVAAATGVSCGSKASGPAPSPTPVQTTTITISSSGVSPKNIQVDVGQRVRFVNNDSRSHNMTSDPHPDHNDCPDINQVGFLAAGQSRETGNLVTARTCGFHDHDNPFTTTLQGQIVIR